MTPANIIKALGDTAEVAAEFNVGLPVVSNWKLRGIPKSRLYDLLEMAKAREVKEITPSVLRAALAKGKAA